MKQEVVYAFGRHRYCKRKVESGGPKTAEAKCHITLDS